MLGEETRVGVRDERAGRGPKVHALDVHLYLRIAPELFLKRCVVGGIEKVFEINRNFRNEGMDSSHSPEFAMLEYHAAYETYDSMAVLTRELYPSLSAALGAEITPDTPVHLLRKHALAHGVEVDPARWGHGS